MYEISQDALGFDVIASWGACVFDPFPVDEDVVTWCDSFGMFYENRCSSAWFISYIARIEDCEDYGGTWVYPSSTKEQCEADGVCYIYSIKLLSFFSMDAGN